MKLEGSLDAFSLPDIFQLLSFTKKSGGLHLRRAATHGCVYFREGAVTGATSDDGKQALARRLVGSGAVADDALAAAVDRAASDGVGVAKALLDAGAIDADTLSAMVSEQAVDAVFDFLRWAEGDFSFSLDEPGPDDIGVQLGVEDLVEQARGRLESWDHACQVVPSPDVVLALPISVREDPRLSRAEWALLALVDGRRTVADLVALAGRGDFAVVSALATLVERELLVVRDGGVDDGADALARRHGVLARHEGNAGGAGEPVEKEPASKEQPRQEQAQQEQPQQEEAQQGRRPQEQRPQQQFASAAPAARRSALSSDEHLPPDESLFAGVTNAEVSAASTVASVLAAAANGAGDASRGSSARAKDDGPSARLVADTRAPVIPPRPEPFMPRRRPDFPEEAPRSGMGTGIGAGMGMGGPIVGSAAVAADTREETPEGKVHIERDPSVNKSLLLRLIAGVRGL